MTNSKRKDPLQEARNPVHNRIRFQKRMQEEKELEKYIEEELRRLSEEEDFDDPLP